MFIGAKKREDALDVMEKAELDLPEYEPVKNILTAEDKLRFNEQQEIHSKMCGVLLSFVEIARSEKLHQYCVKYYEKYVQYVQKHYGFIEASTAYFKYGNYLYETKNFDKAEDAFKRCE